MEDMAHQLTASLAVFRHGPESAYKHLNGAAGAEGLVIRNPKP